MQRVTKVFTVSRGGAKVHGEFDRPTGKGRVVCSKCGPQKTISALSPDSMTMRAVMHQTDENAHN